MAGFYWVFLLSLALQPAQTVIVCTVTAGGAPVAGAEIVVAGKTYMTNRAGVARIEVTPGPVELSVVKDTFAPVTTTVTVAAGEEQPGTIGADKPPKGGEGG